MYFHQMTNSVLLFFFPLFFMFFFQFVFFKYEEKVGHPILSVVDILQRSDESYLTYSGSPSGKKAMTALQGPGVAAGQRG